MWVFKIYFFMVFVLKTIFKLFEQAFFLLHNMIEKLCVLWIFTEIHDFILFNSLACITKLLVFSILGFFISTSNPYFNQILISTFNKIIELWNLKIEPLKVVAKIRDHLLEVWSSKNTKHTRNY